MDTYDNSENGQYYITDTYNKDKKIQLLSDRVFESDGKKFAIFFVFEDFN